MILRVVIASPYPTLQNLSDHLLKTINKDFEKDIEQANGEAMSEEAMTINNISWETFSTIPGMIVL